MSDDGKPRHKYGPLDRQKPLPETLKLILDEMMQPSMRHRDPDAASAREKVNDQRPTEAELISSRPGRRGTPRG